MISNKTWNKTIHPIKNKSQSNDSKSDLREQIVSKKHLKTHVPSIHEGKTSFECEFCKYTFPKQNLKNIL